MNKKTSIKIIIILFILMIAIKIIQINFIENIRVEIKKFEQLDNIYYKELYTNNNNKIEINIIQKGNLIKETTKFFTIDNYTTRIIDLENNITIIIDENFNIYKIEEYNKENYKKLTNSPKTLETLVEINEEVKKGYIFSVFNCFRILYITPSKYNNIDCYKIKTTRETFYIDRKTLFPIYLEYNQTNSSNGEKEKIKIEYVFKENCVTDEDVKIPDLNNYTLVPN